MKLTKKMMVDEIEKSGLVIDFDRKYLLRKSKDYLYRLYLHCVNYKNQANT